jgi:hypothetical protein
MTEAHQNRGPGIGSYTHRCRKQPVGYSTSAGVLRPPRRIAALPVPLKLYGRLGQVHRAKPLIPPVLKKLSPAEWN